MKMTKRSIKYISKFLYFILITLTILSSCNINTNNRLKINGYSIGDNILEQDFHVIKEYYELDFPFKEIILKSDTNIFLKTAVYKKENIIFYIERRKITQSLVEEIKKEIIKYTGTIPKFQADKKISGIWNCSWYSWQKDQFNDEINLYSCNLINEKFINENWILSIENDTLRSELLIK